MLDFDPPEEPEERTYWWHEGQMWMLMRITDNKYIFQTRNRDEKIVDIKKFGTGWEQRTGGWEDFPPTKQGPSPSCNIL
jgi:hypothetical protein|tara:strand:+ start:187 stop:423 length:237 start_codon:yes stop_codon:yes gene_type:complete